MAVQKNKTYGVTGANGFIGKKFIASLSQVEYINGDLKKAENEHNKFSYNVILADNLVRAIFDNGIKFKVMNVSGLSLDIDKETFD